MSRNDKLINFIEHYKKKIEKHPEQEKLCHYLNQLRKLPINIDHLQITGIGRVINVLRKQNGEVGEKAKELIYKWKTMVAASESCISQAYLNNNQIINKNNLHDSYQVSEKQSKNFVNYKTQYVCDVCSEQEKEVRLKNSQNVIVKKSKNIVSNSNPNYAYTSDQDEIDDCIDDDEHKMEIDLQLHDNHCNKIQNDDKSYVSKVNNIQLTWELEKCSSKNFKKSNNKVCNVGNTKKCKYEQINKNKNYAEHTTHQQKKDDSDYIPHIFSSSSFDDAMGNGDILLQYSKHKKKQKFKNKNKIAESSKLAKEEFKNETEYEISNNMKYFDKLDNLNLPQVDPDLKSPCFVPMSLVVKSKHKSHDEEEALHQLITAKHIRTKVYSGNKTYLLSVSTLVDLCIKILQENINGIEYTGGVPYDILLPVLKIAQPEQLELLEYYNPYLIDDTDELWQKHCNKFFKNKDREEFESWRETYFRCKEDEEIHLKMLTESIMQSQAAATPARQIKLAYVDSDVKPSQKILRQQIRNNTKESFLTKVSCDNEKKQTSISLNVNSSLGSKKPKIAPLMQKTLKFMKNRFRK